MEKLSLGFSPCPNDCFIFDALVHKKIDTENLLFDFIICDVEELNRKAFSKNIDVTKLSFHAFAHVINDFQMLDSGAALGFGVGPLLISKRAFDTAEINSLKIAIPGKYTTANFLFSLAFPGVKNIQEMLFSDIEDSLLSGRVDAGLIIHENRFTYEKKGLMKIIDLGEWWETQTGMPIPLGGIAIKRSLTPEIKSSVNRVIRRSVEFAFANQFSSLEFVKQHAREMNDEVIRKHINLYVNEFSLDLGEPGRNAVKVLMERAVGEGIAQADNKGFFKKIFLSQ